MIASSTYHARVKRLSNISRYGANPRYTIVPNNVQGRDVNIRVHEGPSAKTVDECTFHHDQSSNEASASITSDGIDLAYAHLILGPRNVGKSTFCNVVAAPINLLYDDLKKYRPVDGFLKPDDFVPVQRYLALNTAEGHTISTSPMNNLTMFHKEMIEQTSEDGMTSESFVAGHFLLDTPGLVDNNSSIETLYRRVDCDFKHKGFWPTVDSEDPRKRMNADTAYLHSMKASLENMQDGTPVRIKTVSVCLGTVTDFNPTAYDEVITTILSNFGNVIADQGVFDIIFNKHSSPSSSCWMNPGDPAHLDQLKRRLASLRLDLKARGGEDDQLEIEIMRTKVEIADCQDVIFDQAACIRCQDDLKPIQQYFDSKLSEFTKLTSVRVRFLLFDTAPQTFDEVMCSIRSRQSFIKSRLIMTNRGVLPRSLVTSKPTNLILSHELLCDDILHGKKAPIYKHNLTDQYSKIERAMKLTLKEFNKTMATFMRNHAEIVTRSEDLITFINEKALILSPQCTVAGTDDHAIVACGFWHETTSGRLTLRLIPILNEANCVPPFSRIDIPGTRVTETSKWEFNFTDVFFHNDVIRLNLGSALSTNHCVFMEQSPLRTKEIKWSAGKILSLRELHSRNIPLSITVEAEADFEPVRIELATLSAAIQNQRETFMNKLRFISDELEAIKEATKSSKGTASRVRGKLESALNAARDVDDHMPITLAPILTRLQETSDQIRSIKKVVTVPTMTLCDRLQEASDTPAEIPSRINNQTQILRVVEGTSDVSKTSYYLMAARWSNFTTDLNAELSQIERQAMDQIETTLRHQSDLMASMKLLISELALQYTRACTLALEVDNLLRDQIPSYIISSLNDLHNKMQERVHHDSITEDDLRAEKDKTIELFNHVIMERITERSRTFSDKAEEVMRKQSQGNGPINFDMLMVELIENTFIVLPPTKPESQKVASRPGNKSQYEAENRRRLAGIRELLASIPDVAANTRADKIVMPPALSKNLREYQQQIADYAESRRRMMEDDITTTSKLHDKMFEDGWV